ncbi:uncharacterized protein C1orf167 homolog isoform X3 [Macrotis lagotis]|uniref:uncharacterized protein C1orf167 homolog isoform X3 n=1 Tax=Macrotis lagotis TaxID=92651 RepID=UPI003D6920BB
MDTIRKENMPPWPGDHLKSGPRLVQKNVNISASAGNGHDIKMVSCWATGKRSTPAILPGLGRPVVNSYGSRQPSTLVQNNTAPPGQPLQDATSLVSNSCFQQQNNLQPQPGRPRASGKWRGFPFQQSNMKLRREDPKRRLGNRSPQSLEEPDWNLEHCSQELLWPQRSRSVPWPSRSDNQNHGHPFLRDRPSSSFSGLGNTVQASPKATKARGSEMRPPSRSGPKNCPVQPCPRPRSTLGCWAPSPRPLTLDDLAPSNQRQRSAHSLVLGPRAELSLESARLLLSRKRSKWPMELPLLRPSQEHPSPLTHLERTVPPEAPSNITPGYSSPLNYSCRTMPPEASPNLTPGHHNPLTHPCNLVPLEASPNLKAGYPNPLTHPCRAVPQEAPPNQIPGHPRSLSHFYKAVPLEASRNLIPAHPRSLSHLYKAVPLEDSPNLTPGHPNSLTHSYRAVPPEASPNLASGIPNPLIYPCRAPPQETSPNLTPRHSSSHSHLYQAVPPEASPNLTPGHPSAFTHLYRTVPLDVPQNLTSGHPNPLTYPYKVVPPEASPSLTSGHHPFTHSCRAVPPEASANQTPGHSSSLTHLYKAVPQETSPHLTPGHPNPLIHPCRAVPSEVPPNLISGHPSSLTHPYKVVPPETPPNLMPGNPSHHTFPSSSGPLRYHSLFTLSHRTMSSETSPKLSPRHPKTLSLFPKTLSTEDHSNLTPGYTSLHPPYNKAGSPETPPNLTPESPSPQLGSNRIESLEVPPILITGNLSNLPQSRAGGAEVPSNLTMKHCPHSCSISSRSPEASHKLILGHPNPSTSSHSTLSPVISPDLPPERPSTPTSSHSTMKSVIFSDLTSEHSSPPTLSHSTLSPLISSDLISGPPSTPPLSHGTLSPPISPDLPPGTSTVSHNTMSPGISPDQTLGYPSPHTLSCKMTTPEASPKLIPGSSSLHPHSNKTNVPEASTSLTQGYPSPLPLSHRDVTPEASPSLTLGCPQGMQKFLGAFDISKTQDWSQDPDIKKRADASLPSSGDGHSKTTPSSPPGTSGKNVFRAPKPSSFPHPAMTAYSGGALPSAFPQATCDKLSLPSGRGAALGDPQQAMPVSPETSSLLMSQGQGQGLMETQLEGHLKRIWEIFLSLVPQGTETPRPGPKKGTLLTLSESEGGARQSFLKNAPPEPHLSGQEQRLDSRTSFSASSSLGVYCPSQQQLEVSLRATQHQGPWMEQGTGRSFAARSQNRSELHQQLKLERRKKSSMEPLTPEHKELRVLLTRCFKAWQYYLLRKEIIAKVLRRRHLLRKGIRAMRWSLWLRQAQIEFMKRKQGRTVLAQSFQKWKDLYLNRKERKPLMQSRTEIPEKELNPSQKDQPKRPIETLGLVCGVEGAPKIQLYPRWKLGSQDPRASGTQDLQRLTVFHLWYLQKVLMAEIRKEAWAREKLGKKKLQRIFQAWMTRTMNTARICSLVTQHQRAQLGRCFRAWRCHTQRRIWCQDRLIHWRVEILRKSLHQWVKMMWLQATYSRIVTELYLHRQKSWHLEATMVQEGSGRELVSQSPGKQSQPGHHRGTRGKDALEEACRKLKLHRVFLLWSQRLVQFQRADSFSQSRKLQLLQRTLQRWQQMIQATESPPTSCATCPREPLVGSQDSEESSTSSGLLSSVLVSGSSTPRSSLGEVHSPTDSSSNSLSLVGDDPPWVLPLGLKSLFSEATESWKISSPLGQKWSQLWEWQQPGPWRLLLAYPPPGEETGAPRNTVQVPRDPGCLGTSWHETGWQQGTQQALEVKQHCQITLQTCVICSWNLCTADQGVWWELFCQQGVWGLTQEALHHWHTSWQRQQALQEPQHWPHILKRIVCGGWPQKVSKQRNAASCQEIHFQVSHHMVLAVLNLWVSLWTLQAIQRRTLTELAEVINFRGQDWRTSRSQIYHIRQHHLLRFPWDHKGMLRYQLTKKPEDTSVGLWTKNNAMHPRHPWRLAIRGRHMLCVDLDTFGKQVDNYWTRAIALAQAKRTLHSLIGQRERLVFLGQTVVAGMELEDMAEAVAAASGGLVFAKQAQYPLSGL